MIPKEEYGRAVWQVLHSYTSNLPERLNRTDKIKFRQTLHDLIEHFPCEDCQKGAKSWIYDHKPTFNTNKDAFVWTCDFHNAVNDKLGKPRQDCHALWDSHSTCDTCSVTHDNIHHSTPNNKTNPNGEIINHLQSVEKKVTNQHSNGHTPNESRDNPTNHLDQNHSDNTSNETTKESTDEKMFKHLFPPEQKQIQTLNTYSTNDSATYKTHKNAPTVNQFLFNSLKPSLEGYKDVSTKMFENLCKNAGVPVPVLRFSDKTECTNPDSSCIKMPIGKNGVVVKDVPTIVYLNTNQYSPRSIVHEFLHYYYKLKGISTWNNEEEISRQSRELIARDFPMQKNDTVKQSLHKIDTIKELTDEEPFDPLDWKKVRKRGKERLKSATEDLPYFSRYYGPNKKKHQGQDPNPRVQPTVTYSDGSPAFPQVATQTPEEEEKERRDNEGFITALNPIFAPFADVLGMRAVDVNVAHTAPLIANAGIVLTESNMNKFGSMMISLISSGITLAAGTLTKDSLGYLDKRLLVGLGGVLLWNGVFRYIANPKHMGEVVDQAMHFGQGASDMDVEALVASVTTEDGKKVPEKEPLGKIREREPNWRKNLSSPLGGQEVPFTSYERRSELTGDIYSDPDLVDSANGVLGSGSTGSWVGSAGRSWRRPPFFPSM